MISKKDIYTIFENPSKHKYGIFINILIFVNILISIIIMFLMTEKTLSVYHDIFNNINDINIIIFAVEYILRIYSINYKQHISRFRHSLSPFMIIDFLAILPSLLIFLDINSSFLRTLRIIRIFKLFRITKYSKVDDIVVEILSEKKEEFIFVFLAILILLFTMTPLIYTFESVAQPEVFNSMSTTLWWSITTFTTIGYGDMYPITTLGRFFTSIISILGIAFYAIPGAIFTASLLDKVSRKKKKK